VRDSTLCVLPEAYGEVMSIEIGGHITDGSFDDRALGPKNVVESELGSNPSHIGVRFTRWFTSLKAFSTCLSLLVILRSLHEGSVMAKVD
jgi:hypothetical protein